MDSDESDHDEEEVRFQVGPTRNFDIMDTKKLQTSLYETKPLIIYNQYITNIVLVNIIWQVRCCHTGY
jgi:hypothetical protein